MLTLLLACAPSLNATNTAAASEGSSATLRELNLEEVSTGQWEAEVDEPGPVIVACESEGGAYTYGPSDDPTISLHWSPVDNIYKVVADDSFADCHLWLIK